MNRERNNSSTILIQRKSQFQGGAIPFKVFINNIEAGRLKKGETLKLSVKPNELTLQIKTWSNKSKPLSIKVSPGQTITLDCGLSASGLYLTDPDNLSKDDLAQQDTEASYSNWATENWYTVGLCIILCSGLVGAIFWQSVGGGWTGGLGVLCGYLMSYIIYKTRSTPS